MQGLDVASPDFLARSFCALWRVVWAGQGIRCVLGTFMAEDSDVHSAVISSALNFVCRKSRDQSASVKGIKIPEVEGSPSSSSAAFPSFMLFLVVLASSDRGLFLSPWELAAPGLEAARQPAVCAGTPFQVKRIPNFTNGCCTFILCL